MKPFATLVITDSDLIVMGSAAAVIFGWAALAYMRGFISAWREDQKRPLQFVFRKMDNLGPGYAGGDNAWGGCLVTDSPVDAITGEELRAAVERYRARSSAPVDGDRFEFKEGELWLIG